MHREGFYDHHQQAVISGTANATPQFVGAYNEVCPQGYVWYIELANSFVGGGHTAIVDLFVVTASNPTVSANGTIADRAGRQWNFGAAATNGAADFSGPGIYVPSGYFIVAAFTGGTLAQNDVCLLNMQLAWHQLVGSEVAMSGQDVRQVEASHQKATAPVARPATAEERAYDDAGIEEFHVVKDPFEVPAG